MEIYNYGMEIHRLTLREKRQQLHHLADDQQEPTDCVWQGQRNVSSATSKELFTEAMNTFAKE